MIMMIFGRLDANGWDGKLSLKLEFGIGSGSGENVQAVIFYLLQSTNLMKS